MKYKITLGDVMKIEPVSYTHLVGLVGGAGIVHIIVVAYAPGNCPPAVSTFQKTAEQVDFPAFWRSTGIPL